MQPQQQFYYSVPQEVPEAPDDLEDDNSFDDGAGGGIPEENPQFLGSALAPVTEKVDSDMDDMSIEDENAGIGVPDELFGSNAKNPQNIMVSGQVNPNTKNISNLDISQDFRS